MAMVTFQGAISLSVRLLLSAKNKSNLCREELVERVNELEGVVGSVVSEADATIAIYKNQVTDLAQQVSSGIGKLFLSLFFVTDSNIPADRVKTISVNV